MTTPPTAPPKIEPIFPFEEDLLSEGFGPPIARPAGLVLEESLDPAPAWLPVDFVRDAEDGGGFDIGVSFCDLRGILAVAGQMPSKVGLNTRTL